MNLSMTSRTQRQHQGSELMLDRQGRIEVHRDPEERARIARPELRRHPGRNHRIRRPARGAATG